MSVVLMNLFIVDLFLQEFLQEIVWLQFKTWVQHGRGSTLQASAQE